MLSMFEQGKPLSEEEFAETEKYFEVTFPGVYRQFMLTYNGGVVDFGSFFFQNPMRTEPQEEQIAWFYEIDPTSNSDIRESNELRKGRFPKKFIAIGCDGGGNEICIDCNAGAGYGKIYFWDHDFEADQESGETPEQAPNYYLIAENFTAFTDCLFEPDPPELSPNDSIKPDEQDPQDLAMLHDLMRRHGMDVP